MRRICINLDRRPDKWARFVATCPWPDVERFAGVDCERCPPPAWFKSGGGAWGCYRSHLAVIERALNEDWDGVTILEDDAVPCRAFHRRYRLFTNALPADWGMAYLGGQVLYDRFHPPRPVSGRRCFRPFDVNRNHAFMISRRAMPEIYQHLCNVREWASGNHIDHHLGVWHHKPSSLVYAPPRWIFTQGGGVSDITGQLKPPEEWPDPIDLSRKRPEVIRLGSINGLLNIVVGRPDKLPQRATP